MSRREKRQGNVRWKWPQFIMLSCDCQKIKREKKGVTLLNTNYPFRIMLCANSENHISFGMQEKWFSVSHLSGSLNIEERGNIVMIFCLQSCLLCQCIQGYSPLFVLSVSVYLVLSWGLWSTWIWVLFMVIDYGSSLLLTNIHFDQQYVLKMLSFSLVYISGFFFKNQVSICVWI